MFRLAAELRRTRSVFVPPAGLVPIYQQPDVLLTIKALLVSLETVEQKYVVRTAIIRALISVLSGQVPDRKPLQPSLLRKVRQ